MDALIGVTFDLKNFQKNINTVIQRIDKVKRKVQGHFSQINPDTIELEFMKGARWALDRWEIRTKTNRMTNLMKGFKFVSTNQGTYERSIKITHTYDKGGNFEWTNPYSGKKYITPRQLVLNVLQKGRRPFQIPKDANHQGSPLLVWKDGRRAFYWKTNPPQFIKVPKHDPKGGTDFIGFGFRSVQKYVDRIRNVIETAIQGTP